MNVTLISEDGVEPVTLAEAKQQCYIPTSDNDPTTEAILNRLITASRKYAEGRTWRSLADKTLEYRLDEFPYGQTTSFEGGKLNRNVIDIPNAPLRGVTSIKYIINGTESTLSADSYTVDTNSTPGRIEPDQFWPNTDDVIDAVRIRYTAGYGDTEVAEGDDTSNVPGDIKLAILMMVKFLYDNRDSYVILERGGEYHEAPIGTNIILDTHSLRRFV